MAFTYNLATDTGKVRFRVGDTEDRTTERESLTDAEIALILSDNGDNISQSAIVACMRLIALLRHKISRSVSNVNSSQGSKLEGLEGLLDDLKAEAGENVEMDAGDGGISVDAIATIHEDDDFPAEAFAIAMDDKAYP